MKRPRNRGGSGEALCGKLPVPSGADGSVLLDWVQLDQFQRTRGVLRIFAMALRIAGKDHATRGGECVFAEAGRDGLSDAMRTWWTSRMRSQPKGRSAWSGILNRSLALRGYSADFPALDTRD